MNSMRHTIIQAVVWIIMITKQISCRYVYLVTTESYQTVTEIIQHSYLIMHKFWPRICQILSSSIRSTIVHIDDNRHRLISEYLLLIRLDR